MDRGQPHRGRIRLPLRRLRRRALNAVSLHGEPREDRADVLSSGHDAPTRFPVGLHPISGFGRAA